MAADSYGVELDHVSTADKNENRLDNNDDNVSDNEENDNKSSNHPFPPQTVMTSYASAPLA